MNSPSNEKGATSESSNLSGLDWQKYLGFIVGASASVLICIKLLAVAGWDSTTAFGILAAAGTANVLTGTLLAVLPLLYGMLALVILPRVERRLRRRTPVERSAARLLETWPVILLVFIVPLGVMLVIAGCLVLMIVLSLIQRLKSKRASSRENRREVDPEGSAPSSFETISAGLGGFVIILFGSLQTPWVPPEVAHIEGTDQAVYVLSLAADEATVLVGDGRSLKRVSTDDLSGDYCTVVGGWWNEPVPNLFSEDRYDSCPN